VRQVPELWGESGLQLVDSCGNPPDHIFVF
jgi:hypothetical protein